LHVRSLFPVLFSLFPQVPPPYVLIWLPPKKRFQPKRKNARRVSKHRKKRDGNRWQQRWWPECGSASFFKKGQHKQERKKERNLQWKWMDTLTGHTSCAAGSDSHGQRPSFDPPISARPAEWELVSPPVQHNGAGSSSADTMRMNRELFNYNTNSIWTVTSLSPITHMNWFVE